MDPVVVVGIGELGAVFARGFLECGHPVFPVTRNSGVPEVADPALVLVAVGEPDLDAVLASLPATWRERVGLLQNELRPTTWRAHGIDTPTVAVVWFEKKPTTPVRQLLPTVLHGPRARLLAEALSAVGVATRLAADAAELELELGQKNLSILTTNLAGMEAGGSVSELWERQRELALAVARDVLALERREAGIELPEGPLLEGLARAIAADPEHACTGRSAPARLARALARAERLGVQVPALRRIAERERAR